MKKASKKRIVYTDAPKWVDELFERSKPIDDSFLPSPEEIRAELEREKKKRVTIMLDGDALEKFKKYAKANDMKYQTLINDVIATYARKKL